MSDNLGGGAAGISFIAVATGTVVGLVVYFTTFSPVLTGIAAVVGMLGGGRYAYRLLTK